MSASYVLNHAERYGQYDDADWSRVPTIAPTAPALLAYCTAHYAERELIVFDEERMTYGELDRQSAHLARQLRSVARQVWSRRFEIADAVHTRGAERAQTFGLRHSIAPQPRACRTHCR